MVIVYEHKMVNKRGYPFGAGNLKGFGIWALKKGFPFLSKKGLGPGHMGLLCMQVLGTGGAFPWIAKVGGQRQLEGSDPE